MIRTALFVLFTLSVTGCTRDTVSPPIGTWSIDPVRTVDRAVEAGELSAAEREVWISRFEQISKQHSMTVTEDRILTGKFSTPYTLESGENGTLLLRVDFQGELATLTYTPLEEGFATFRSSATNDMDVWVWRKAP